MKKILFVSVFLCAFSFLNAQNLENRIPGTADAVISINGDRLLELISITDLNNTTFAKEILKEFNNDGASQKTSLADLGVDINSKAYYFYSKTDSVSYHSFLLKLNSRESFESIFKESDRAEIIRQSGVNTRLDGDALAIWDNNTFLVAVADAQYSFFDENEERLLSQSKNKEETFYEMKRRVTGDWVTQFAKNIFQGAARSVISNKSYMASIDSKSAASVWIKNYGQLIGKSLADIYGSTLGMRQMGLATESLNGFESVVAHLYFEEDAAKIAMSMQVSDDWQRIFKKIYNSKFDRNMLQYFNQDDAMAYFSISLDTEELMNEYPAMITKMYGGMLPEYSDEMGLAAEFVSMMLDEEAIGELMTGDALFVLHNAQEKEVEYTTYEYDEDYNRKEVKKTKKEVLPDFTFMIGTEKEKFFQRLARSGVKHKLFTSKSGYFKVEAPKKEIPVDVFALVKDNILFFTTSEKMASAIVSGSVNSNLGKHHKLIRKNIYTLYFNGQKIMDIVPKDAMSTKDKEHFSLVKDSFVDGYITASKMKGNKMNSEFIINTSGKQENSLRLLIDLFDQVIK